ncbi:uncharacterized protein LOC142221044 isoform X4 [Haematobia irritans]|uniref:uncharacterized protein LOC142221044 isoform X4 n=1 Tax=Haematobia irritans TaxID=7368 RepID=UPI003F4F8E86
MKPLKGGGINKKSKTMDYTNYAYNEAVGRLKLMLASDSYTPSKTATSSYLRGINDDSADNYSDNMSAIDRPVYADISKYLSPSQKSRIGVTPSASAYRKHLSSFSASKENLASATLYQPAMSNAASTIDYYSGGATNKPLTTVTTAPTDSVQAPVEIFNFIEKQEDYIEQLEKESKYCRNELSNLLGKVKDVINENEQLTDIARSELGNMGKGLAEKLTTSPSSDSDDLYGKSKVATPRKKDGKSPRYAAAPNIVYEARISELEAELMQAQIDLKRVKTENEDLKKKLARSDPLALVSVPNSATNCEVHRKQIDLLQTDKSALEETIRHLQKALDEAKSQQYSQSSKRYINDLVQMERSQAEMEVRHLRDELDRQHERVREMQMEMARRLADERSNAERRYNNQVDQLGGDLSSQWEQVAKLQLELERQKRYEGDLKRDLANRNSQIEELKMELRANRSTFLADMAQVNAEKQSLEQEITALRLQLDRATRENKTEAARLNAEINSLRQRLDRADADLLHSKREVLRLNDEIASLEKELAYGEMKNEIRPTKKDLDKRISELQEKHAETVNELEEMIQSQKQLMDKLTGECKVLTSKLEDTTLKHNTEKQNLREMNSKLMDRLKHIWFSYKDLSNKLHTANGQAIHLSPMNSDHEKSDREEHNSISHTHHNKLSTTTTTTILTNTTPQTHSHPEEQHRQYKPLSTTSRPHLAQPTSHSHPSQQMPTTPTTVVEVATPQIPIATIPYWVKLQPEISTTPAAPISQGQIQQHQHMIPTTSPNMIQQQQQEVMTTSQQSTALTTMTKISRTTLAKEKRNSNNNNSQESQMLAIQIRTQQITPLPPSSSSHKTQTWPPRANTEQTTIRAMRDMTSHNMMPVPMTKTTINPNTIRANMTQPDQVMMPQPMTTMPQTMIPLHISTTPVARDRLTQQQSQPVPHRKKNKHHHHSQHPQPHQLLLQHQLQQVPLLEEVAQQKAAHNRERAVALWGQQLQLEASPAENPLCHNSLPRQQPKSSRDPELDLTTNLTFDCIDPFDLEFSISSPSLIRSFSDSDTEVEELEIDPLHAPSMGELQFDSISEMGTITPTPTTTRRIEALTENLNVYGSERNGT